MIKQLRTLVHNYLQHDKTGHGIDHIDRVTNLAVTFATKEKANIELTTMIALLHDVDDYKLVGLDKADHLGNTKKMLEIIKVPLSLQQKVLEGVGTIGFHKRLKGILPLFLEAKIVSDADMVDAIGAIGLMRAHTYSFQHQEPFFDRDIFPLETMTLTEYTSPRKTTTVCHLFEKILKLKDFMMTAAGKEEALKRHHVIVEFLRQYFVEMEAPAWSHYLEQFLKTNR